MNAIFLLILSLYAQANMEIDQKLHEEMQFLEQEEQIVEVANTTAPAPDEKTEEEILDLEKQYLSDEVSSAVAAPKRRRQAKETTDSSIMDGPSL